MLEKIFRSRRSKARLFAYIDCILPKHKDKILFVVKDRTHFSGNLRVMLEAYLAQGKDNIYIYKDGNYIPKLKKELEDVGVHVLTSFSFYSIWHLLTSGVIILSHNPRDAHFTKKCKQRTIINLWHGVAIKKIELLMPNIDKEKQALLQNNSTLYDMLIASSEEDKITNAKAFGVSLDKVHITGLPRYEILKEDYHLGVFLQKEEEKIKNIKDNRKLVLWAPTFRENSTSPLEQITKDEWLKLHNFAKKENILFGIRPHPYDIKYLPPSIQNLTHFHLFDNIEYTEINLLLKHTTVLVIDFSSIWVDYLLLHKPMVGFAKDYTRYLQEERGFIYDFKSIFPVEFSTNIETLIEEIGKNLSGNEYVDYSHALKSFHAYSLEFNYKEIIYEKIESIRNKNKENK